MQPVAQLRFVGGRQAHRSCADLAVLTERLLLTSLLTEGGIVFVRAATEKQTAPQNRVPEGARGSVGDVPHCGKLIVLTAPLTESIDHAGFFIQMALASIPKWLEFVLN